MICGKSQLGHCVNKHHVAVLLVKEHNRECTKPTQGIC